MANSRWQTLKSWQTRSFTRQTRVKSDQITTHSNLQHGRLISAVTRGTHVEQ